METPNTGDIHGKIRYECNDELVSSASAALFKPGEKLADRTIRDVKGGEFWIRNLKPGVYNLHWSSPPTIMYEGEGKSVTVERGKLLDLTLYIAGNEDCPLIRLIYPEDHQMITITQPEFQWEEFRSGYWYDVIVWGDFKNGFAFNFLEDTQKTSCSYNTSNEQFNLIPGYTYSWEVCAFRKDQRDRICSIDRSFKVTSNAQ